MKGKKCKCVEDVCNKCIKKTRKRNRKVKPKGIPGVNLQFSQPVQPVMISQIPRGFTNANANESNELISLIKSLLAKSPNKPTEAQTQTDAQDIFNEYSSQTPVKMKAPNVPRFNLPGFNTNIFDEYSAEPIIYVEPEPVMSQVSEPIKMKAPNVPGNYFVKENRKIRIYDDDEPIYVEAEQEPIIIENEYVKPPDFETVIKEANEDALLKGLKASKKESFRLAKEERRLKAEEEVRQRNEASDKKEAELVLKRIEMEEEERQRKEAELVLKRIKMEEEERSLRETLLKIQMTNYDINNKHSGKPITQQKTIKRRNQKRDLYEAEYINKLEGLNLSQLKSKINKLNKSKTKEFNI